MFLVNLRTSVFNKLEYQNKPTRSRISQRATALFDKLSVLKQAKLSNKSTEYISLNSHIELKYSFIGHLLICTRKTNLSQSAIVPSKYTTQRGAKRLELHNHLPRRFALVINIRRQRNIEVNQHHFYVWNKALFLFINSRESIPYPSNGSFNPYVITNKEAHIINGNIFISNADNCTDKKTESLCVTHSGQSIDTIHFMNYCLNHPGKFSCAVDSFLEISFAIFKNYLHNVKLNDFKTDIMEETHPG